MTSQELLAAYEQAQQWDDRADQLMDEAEARFRRWRRRMGDNAAYDAAGVPMADRRSLKASADVRRLRQLIYSDQAFVEAQRAISIRRLAANDAGR